MLAAARNYDVICLQMRNYLPQQDEPVRHETDRFITAVKAIITSEGPIKSKLDKFIPQIFNFKLQALKWISQQPNINLDFGRLLEVAYPTFERLKNNPKLELLAENTLFALRCNSRVMKAVMADINSIEFSKEIIDVPVNTYEQFFGTLALSIPDQDTFQKIADFSHASLYIEFILLAAILINEENINVPDANIKELATLIADAAQEYSDLASLMGILPVRQRPLTMAGVSGFSQEDQLLSNLGLSEFAKNF